MPSCIRQLAVLLFLSLVAPSLCVAESIDDVIISSYNSQPYGCISDWKMLPGLPQRIYYDNPLKQQIERDRRNGNIEHALLLEQLLTENKLSQFQKDFLATAREMSKPKQLELLRQLSAREPDNETILFDIASTLMNMDSPREAISIYEILLKKNPGIADAWNDVGVALVRAGRIEDGERALLRSLSIATETVDSMYNLGTLALRCRDLRKATKWLDELKANHSRYAPSKYERLKLLIAHFKELRPVCPLSEKHTRETEKKGASPALKAGYPSF